MANDANRTHWGICYLDGAVAYGEDDRAYIFFTRQAARKMLDAAKIEAGRKLRIEPLILDPPPAAH